MRTPTQWKADFETTRADSTTGNNGVGFSALMWAAGTAGYNQELYYAAWTL